MVHRRATAACQALRGFCTEREFLQAAGTGYEAGIHRLGAEQPLRADSYPEIHAGAGAGNAAELRCPDSSAVPTGIHRHARGSAGRDRPKNPAAQTADEINVYHLDAVQRKAKG